jgi:glycosidase
MPRPLARTLLPALPLALALAACGDATVSRRDDGTPPTPPTFDPGFGGSGGSYGSGSSGGSSSTTPVDAGPPVPVCVEDYRGCPQLVTFPYGGESSVEVRGNFGGDATWQQGAAMTRSGSEWQATIVVPYARPTLLKFFVNGTDWRVDPSKPTQTDGSGNVNNLLAPVTCTPYVCNEPPAAPAGVFDWRDSVIYFAFVDRFLDGNPANNCSVAGVSGAIADYQGGDWAGIARKIDEGYFNDLGVNTLWLTVPLDNTPTRGRGVGGDDKYYSGYHGYWPKMDSTNPAQLQQEGCFGTLEELKGVVTKAHAKGLKVLFDYAMVHVHASSGVFAQNPSWFWPNSNGRGGDCICGQGCSWDTMPDRERCWFTDYLPHWNFTNNAARNYSVTNAVEWAKQTGIDGFRIDAIKHVDISWLTELRARLQREVVPTQTPPQRFYMVGETYDFGNRDILRAYVDPATKLDGQFDFPARRHIVEAILMRTMRLADMVAFLDGNDGFYGSNAIMSTFIGNHDLPRVIHLAANSRLWGDNQYADGKDRAWSQPPIGAPSEREAYERMANGFAILAATKGAPLVYYGDEIGLPGAGDPDNRRFMAWSGLGSNQTWLRERVSKLFKIREAHPALRRGTRQTVSLTNDTWLFKMSTAGDTVYVAVNRGDGPATVSGLPSTVALRELVNGTAQQSSTVSVPARQTLFFAAP